MEKKKIVGVEGVSYTNKNGQAVTGVRIHILSPLFPPHVGHSASSEYISNANVSDFHIGEVDAILYEPTFNGKYRCTGVIYTPANK